MRITDHTPPTMSKLHWHRILSDPASKELLWKELGHDEPERLDEACSISSPVGDNALITFHYDDVQGNPASCGIEKLGGKYLFFGEYCAYEDDAGPFDVFEEAFRGITDKKPIEVEAINYEMTSTLPNAQTLELCANHVAEGYTILINQEMCVMREGALVMA